MKVADSGKVRIIFPLILNIHLKFFCLVKVVFFFVLVKYVPDKVLSAAELKCRPLKYLLPVEQFNSSSFFLILVFSVADIFVKPFTILHS